jgi:hypothetical protein
MKRLLFALLTVSVALSLTSWAAHCGNDCPAGPGVGFVALLLCRRGNSATQRVVRRAPHCLGEESEAGSLCRQTSFDSISSK